MVGLFLRYVYITRNGHEYEIETLLKFFWGLKAKIRSRKFELMSSRSSARHFHVNNI